MRDLLSVFKRFKLRAMRVPWLLLMCLFALSACSSRHPRTLHLDYTTTPAPSELSNWEGPRRSESKIKIGGPLRGRVASVNPAGRFVVLRFPIGPMPALQQRFAVFRQGVKVGQLKVSGPQYDNNTVADIVLGDCRVGDEVKAE